MRISEAIVQKPRHRAQARELYRYATKLENGKRKNKRRREHRQP